MLASNEDAAFCCALLLADNDELVPLELELDAAAAAANDKLFNKLEAFIFPKLELLAVDDELLFEACNDARLSLVLVLIELVPLGVTVGVLNVGVDAAVAAAVFSLIIFLILVSTSAVFILLFSNSDDRYFFWSIKEIGLFCKSDLLDGISSFCCCCWLLFEACSNCDRVRLLDLVGLAFSSTFGGKDDDDDDEDDDKLPALKGIDGC